MADIYCELVFLNNPYKVYISGNFIEGTVEFGMEKEREIKDITIYLKAESCCEWKSSIFGGRNKETINFTTVEQELYCKTQCEESEPDLYPFIIYSYPFSIQLEDDTPTSITGTFGQIRYLVSVAIMDDNNEQIKEITEKITIIKRLDLQNIAESFLDAYSTTMHEERYSSDICSCIQSHDIIIKCGFNKSLYLPGEIIDASLHIDNTTVYNVTDINLQLIRILTYFISKNVTRKKVEESIISSTKFIGHFSESKKDEKITLDIPATPPTEINTNINITVEYHLKLSYSIDAYGKAKFGSSLPVIIGSNELTCLSDMILINSIGGNPDDDFDFQENEMSYPILMETYSIVRDAITY